MQDILLVVYESSHTYIYIHVHIRKEGDESMYGTSVPGVSIPVPVLVPVRTFAFPTMTIYAISMVQCIIYLNTFLPFALINVNPV